MYVITFKHKPITMGEISRKENRSHFAQDSSMDQLYICAKTQKHVWIDFLSHFGFTQKEWEQDGYRAEKSVIKEDQ